MELSLCVDHELQIIQAASASKINRRFWAASALIILALLTCSDFIEMREPLYSSVTAYVVSGYFA